MDTLTAPVDSKIVPVSLKNAPSMIEAQLPVNRISAEAYKERKAGAGQTLTALGSYWKGRKPLILVRATVLASLLPSTTNRRRDLEVFLKLMGMHDDSFQNRIKKIDFEVIEKWAPDLFDELVETKPTGGRRRHAFRKMDEVERNWLLGRVLTRMPYDQRLQYCYRPEEVAEEMLLAGIWDDVNDHLGTKATSMAELIEQLGVMRFGHRPKVADTFAGGGSIPFEAARLGCDVYASDLNPIACMLTWGALNIIGADEETRERIEVSQHEVAAAVDTEILRLGIEHDGNGTWLRLGMADRIASAADAVIVDDEGDGQFNETVSSVITCPRTGWRVPLLSNMQVKGRKKQIARLRPDAAARTYHVEVIATANDREWAKAATSGTVQTVGDRLHLVHVPTTGEVHVPIANRAKAYLYCLETRCPTTGWMVPMAPSWVISKTRNVYARLVPDHANKRYDIEILSGATSEEMKEAEKGTVREGALVHPMNPDRQGVSVTLIRGDFKRDDKSRGNKLRLWEKHDFIPQPDDIWQERLYCIQWQTPAGETYFAGVTPEDEAREKVVETIVRDNLSDWQEKGLVPDMEIELGDETTRLTRERGWTHWHHLFNARQTLFFALLRSAPGFKTETILGLASSLDFHSKLCGWGTSPKWDGGPVHTFTNQALNPQSNYANYGLVGILNIFSKTFLKSNRVGHLNSYSIGIHGSHLVNAEVDIGITDPPYADAVNYHEISEFFIAWLRKNPPAPFDSWIWDSQRPLAIKGSDEEFRRGMVEAYRALTNHMPENGMQVVMFTHQDAGVWADLAGIMWTAGLKVTAAWNIVTETESALKEGNYVQGTILLVLRKRTTKENIARMEIEAEIDDEVKDQMRILDKVEEDWTSEIIYTDGDRQLAAYAAALRVVTRYSTIDRQDVGADVFRKLKKGEKTVLRELIDYAAAVANGILMPKGVAKSLWRSLEPEARFYIRLLDMESRGPVKFADFQNFARSLGVPEYTDIMASTTANKAALAGAADLKGQGLGTGRFGQSLLRQVLFAIWKIVQKDMDPKEGVNHLTTAMPPHQYAAKKPSILEMATFLRDRNKSLRPQESEAADLLLEALKMRMDRF